MTDLPDDASGEHPALVAYRRRTSRASRIYAAVLGVLVLLAFIGVRLAYAHGELNKVSFRTAPAPGAVPSGLPGAALRLAWHTDDTAAGGSPYDDGVVVSFAGHTVNGRDAVTGAVRWHYTRSDETLCSVLQQDGSTIAIYRRKGNCDEVTGFVTATGQPKWYRTLTDDGETAAASTPNVVLTANQHIVHAFDNAGGLDRWDWTVPANCTVRHALTGSLGVLVSMDCGGNHQLALHDLLSDTVKWTVNTGAAVLPVAADGFVGALDPATGVVFRYTPDKGAASQSARLPVAVASSSNGSALPTVAAGVTATDAAGQPVQLVLLAGLHAFSQDGSLRWSGSATGPAWPVAGDAYVISQLGPDRVVLRRTEGGQVQLLSVLSPAAGSAGGRVFPVGRGVLVAGVGTALYR
ncbi:MAG TPA: hypothetical protein VFU36_05800 [Jatrophihabitans sp.]|nr:hypothetical protein [Jatrophihabitans sp.]